MSSIIWLLHDPIVWDGLHNTDSARSICINELQYVDPPGSIYTSQYSEPAGSVCIRWAPVYGSCRFHMYKYAPIHGFGRICINELNYMDPAGSNCMRWADPAGSICINEFPYVDPSESICVSQYVDPAGSVCLRWAPVYKSCRIHMY